MPGTCPQAASLLELLSYHLGGNSSYNDVVVSSNKCNVVVSICRIDPKTADIIPSKNWSFTALVDPDSAPQKMRHWDIGIRH